MRKKKKYQKKPNELEVGFNKLADFTSHSINKIYKDYIMGITSDFHNALILSIVAMTSEEESIFDFIK